MVGHNSSKPKKKSKLFARLELSCNTLLMRRRATRLAVPNIALTGSGVLYVKPTKKIKVDIVDIELQQKPSTIDLLNVIMHAPDRRTHAYSGNLSERKKVLTIFYFDGTRRFVGANA